jgi:anaerobic carbon-monoxide dehydrogenase iron sulfur subunit
MRLAIDPLRCTGCLICEVFCSFAHESRVQPSLARIHVTRSEEPWQFTPATCQQCEQPLCAAACPVEAIGRNASTHAMEVDASLCVGCEACIPACPFGAMFWDAARGLPLQCDLCKGSPECARMCPTGALTVPDGGDEMP